MLQIFWEEKWVTLAMVILFCIGVGTRLLMGFLYDSMIRETENMAVTENVMLKQCKTKFIKCFQLNGGVNNVPVYVDKFLSRLEMGPFSFDSLYHLSGQAQLSSIVAAGIGICRAIARGYSLWQVFPFYLACMVELYFYFSVSALVNLKEKRRVLKVNLVDYLENHLSARIDMTQNDLEKLHYVKPGERLTEYMPAGKRLEMVESEEKRENVTAKETEPPTHSDQNLSGQDTWEELLREILNY